MYQRELPGAKRLIRTAARSTAPRVAETISTNKRVFQICLQERLGERELDPRETLVGSWRREGATADVSDSPSSSLTSSSSAEEEAKEGRSHCLCLARASDNEGLGEGRPESLHPESQETRAMQSDQS